MAAETFVVQRCQRLHAEGGGRAQGGVDEEHALAALQIEGVFDLQLKIGETFHIG